MDWRRAAKRGRRVPVVAGIGHRVSSSLRARAVFVVVLVTLAMAVVFSMASMVSVRTSLLDQVTSEARNDFSHQALRAQREIAASDSSQNVQYQRVVNDIAADIQSDGAQNLVGVFMWSRSASINEIIPVSTAPTYASLISDDFRTWTDSQENGTMVYQSIGLPRGTGADVPGMVIGTVLDFGSVGDLEFFGLYSYQSEQESLNHIQLGLIAICVSLSMAIGLMMWLVIRSITDPVKRIAQVAQTLACGDLTAHAIIDRNDEIGTLQRSFNDMVAVLKQKIDALEESEASQKRFVSDVSHELRTPVTTMRMAADLLESRKTGFDPSTRRTVELLSGQIARFQSMLVDLLEMSRYDSGHADVEVMETDIRESLRTALGEVSDIARVKGVTIHLGIPSTAVVAMVDPRRIVRIVRNLLANAIDFAQGNPVDVTISATVRVVVISVRDHGTGMTQRQVTHVFDRFWRGDPSRSRTTGGTGLGMSIALADARLHHGDIHVRSQEGVGTWFLVLLPRDPSYAPISPDDVPLDFIEGSTAMIVRGSFDVVNGSWGGPTPWSGGEPRSGHESRSGHETRSGHEMRSGHDASPYRDARQGGTMMPDGWRWRRICRRLGTAVVCLLAVLGLAGCSALGLPVTGRMMSMPLQTQKTRRVFTDPRGPEDGAQPEDIVEGFVDAMPAGVQNDGYAVARQFLTSAAARSWKGDKKAVIYTGNATFVRYSDDAVSSANRQVVQMDIQVSGMLDSSGVYEPTDSGVSRSVSFTLRRTSKGWRISDAPSGVIVSEAYFDQMFRKVPLYRLASSGTELVPDVRWFPWRNWRTRAVRALLARAVPWLGGAVRNVNKAQVRLASSGVTIENDVPRVELTSEMSTMGAHDRALLVREIRLTLNDGDDQAALDIVVDGKSRYSDADENVTLDGSEDGESLYSLSSGHIVLLNASSPIRVGEVTAGTEKASGFVFAADGGALLRADGSAECLRYTGDSCGALFGGEKLSYIAQGDDGEIWALSRDGRTLHVLHGGVSATLSVPWLGDAVIESFAVSPEGSRLAVSVSSKSADGVRE
ncbi:MAG: MtrAB system histidine kinase MtrB [Bifidobacterium minimum]|nr:MtrAB system histidine kinase MtrB [Bifidobacterium minimum]